MSSADVHVVPVINGWELRRVGQRAPTSRHRTRWSALKAGRVIAAESRSALIVHELDGRISTHPQPAEDSKAEARVTPS